MENKKGFTLIELIAVIVIIGIIAILIVPSISNYIVNTRNTAYTTHEKAMSEAAESYTIECINNNGKDCLIPGPNEEGVLYVSELIDSDFLDKLGDPARNGEFCNPNTSYVKIYNTNRNDFEYTACLYCSSYATEDPQCVTYQGDSDYPQCVTLETHSEWTSESRMVSVGCNDTSSGCVRDVFKKTFNDTTDKGIITITDKSGNSTDCEVEVKVDKTAPTCQIKANGIATNGWYPLGTTFTLTNYQDRESGVLTYGTGTSVHADFNKVLSQTPPRGITRVFGYVKDAAGNIGSCSINAKIKTAYVVKYDKNQGTGSMPNKSCMVDDDCFLDENKFTRRGHTFNGWNRKADGTSTPYADKANVKNIVLSGEVTVFAQWKVNSYTCSAGKYLAKDSIECSDCTANHYCPGGYYPYNPDEDQGINSCPSGYTNSTGQSAKSSCKITCAVNTRVTTANAQCTGTCTAPQTIAQHEVAAGSTSSACTNCTNTTGVATWDTGVCVVKTCAANYYKNGNACTACPSGYSSPAGSTAKSACKITCSANTRVTTSDGTCSGSCGTGTNLAAHDVYAGSTSPTCNGNTYTISYTLNNGSNGTNHPTSGTYGSVVTISNPTKTITAKGNKNGTDATIGSDTSQAQTFAGWTYTDGNTSTAKYGTSSSSVTTSWSSGSTKVTAEYFKNLRSETGTVTLTANWTAVKFNLPTVSKTGYNCKWNTKTDGTGTDYASGAEYTPGTSAPTTLNLYAICTPATTPVITTWKIYRYPQYTQSSPLTKDVATGITGLQSTTPDVSVENGSTVSCTANTSSKKVTCTAYNLGGTTATTKEACEELIKTKLGVTASSYIYIGVNNCQVNGSNSKGKSCCGSNGRPTSSQDGDIFKNNPEGAYGCYWFRGQYNAGHSKESAVCNNWSCYKYNTVVLKGSTDHCKNTCSNSDVGGCFTYGYKMNGGNTDPLCWSRARYWEVVTITYYTSGS